MKVAGLVVGVVMALAVLFVVAIFGASEAGTEIVTLTTTDADGSEVETRLWIVDDDGRAWLRSGVPEAGWLERIEASPEVRVVRGGRSLRMRAVPVREAARRDRVHALMREKYGWADRFISLIRDADGSVAVRLDEVSP